MTRLSYGGRSLAGPATPGLLKRALPRIRGLALALCLFPIIGLVASAVMPSVQLPIALPDLGPLRLISVATLALCVAMYALTRIMADQPRLVCNAALVFEVLIGAAISAVEFIRPVDLNSPPSGVSIVALLLVIYPVTVPAEPRKVALAAFLTAATGPLIELGSYLLGGKYSEVPAFLVMRHLPLFLCAGVALWAARFISGVGKEADAARRMGAYRLVERLGAGGMGEVWRARHDLLARPAAIKLIRPEMLGTPGDAQTALLRFEREAQATAALRSPHAIQVFDFGTTDDGVFYYVMELLEGMDLDRLVRTSGPMPAERVVFLLRQACRALEDAEHNGLIHRDIKPANLFVCRLGPQVDFVKVLDFGLVKAAVADAQLTAENVVSGTPAFLAPEAALGSGAVDHRIDIYAMGCVAYWLLTGTLVFEAESATQAIIMHARDTPDPPSTRVELAIPPALEALVLACLAKDPDDRPATATALLHQLDAVPLARPWTEARAARWWNTHQPRLSPDLGLATTEEVRLP